MRIYNAGLKCAARGSLEKQDPKESPQIHHLGNHGTTLSAYIFTTNCAQYMGSGRGWLAGDWPSTGGIPNITAAAWTAGLHWWHSGNKKRMQNVSEYTLVLALCLFQISDSSA